MSFSETISFMSKMRSMTVVFRDVDVEHTRQCEAVMLRDDKNEQMMCESVK